MMLKRVMGKASFATLQDSSGPHPDLRHARRHRRRALRRLQALGPGRHRGRRRRGCSRPRTGELSIHASSVRLLTKSLRPMPDKFHGIADQEVKYRQRYVDLMTDESARKRFVARSKAVSAHARLHGGQRLPGSRNADAAPDSGRRQRQALQDPPQRAGPGDVPAHRARAVPQAPDRGRFRARVRDQPQLPQRRHLGAPQPRVHHDGVLRGLLELPGPDGLHRSAGARRRHEGLGHAAADLQRPSRWTCRSPSSA